MLVFIVPLRSSQTSKSWELTSKLFERCIKSICNQTSSQFRVIVVCHELPNTKFHYPYVTYLQVDFPVPTWKNDADIYSKETDRSLKVWQGLNHAQIYHPSHIMLVDADDLVSNDLADLIAESPQCNGWYVDKGYEYREGSKNIYCIKTKFHEKCGTCNIIRYDLLDSYKNLQMGDVKGFQFLHHQSVRDTMIENGTSLERLPFEGAIYVIDHGENMWLTAANFTMLKELRFKDLFLFQMRRFIKTIISKPVTERIRQKFGLYTLITDSTNQSNRDESVNR